MKKWTIVSLGISCQTTHQLTRFAAEQSDIAAFHKGPFDWLICPIQSAAQWIDAGLPDFQPDEIIIEREHAYWSKFNFWFWHGFYTKSGESKHLDIKGNMERELNKLNYQRQKFKELDPRSTLFFASNTQNNLSTDVFSNDESELFHFKEQSCNELINSLSNFFGSPVNVGFFSRRDRADPAFLQNKEHIFLESEDSEWKGDDQIWNSALNKHLCSVLPNR